MSAWNKLADHYPGIAPRRISGFFTDNPARANTFSIQFRSMLVDYSKHHFSEDTLNLLIDLALEKNLGEKIKNLFSGGVVNPTENSPALHTAWRNKNGDKEIRNTLLRMETFLEALESNDTRGATGKPIDTIVNIGIGGSDLGPRLAVDALQDYSTHRFNVHFIANIDFRETDKVLECCNPETTLFIVSSKSFSTRETLTNANTIRRWLVEKGGNAAAKQFIAITSNPDAALSFGIEPESVFGIPETVGGRYSVWSAMGLALAASIGMAGFREFLQGAAHMDTHFQSQPLDRNIPVILGLLDVWYINFFKATSQAIIPYDNALQLLPAYLSQLVMESNGKSVTTGNEPVKYHTAPVIWGGVGTNAQHAFMQLLHQGTHLIPVDFLVAINNKGDPAHQKQLVSNCIAQSEALMTGTTDKQLPAFRQLPGNRPSTTILFDRLTPELLGMLLALYEHRTYVQSCIWDINPFDQWGVELGKTISGKILGELESGAPDTDHDPSTRNLINLFLHGTTKQ